MHNLTTVKSAIAVILTVVILGVIIAMLMAVIIVGVAAMGFSEFGGF